MKKIKVNTIDDYISEFPNETQIILQEIKAFIKSLVPTVEEKISYDIPCFTLNNTYLIYFAGYKNHISIYPAPVQQEAFKEAFSIYKTGKGTIQFPLNKPMPWELLKRIVEYRLTENQQRANKKI